MWEPIASLPTLTYNHYTYSPLVVLWYIERQADSHSTPNRNQVVWERPVASKKSSKKQDKKQDKKKKSGKKSGKKPAAPARSSFASSCEMSYSGLTCEMTQTRLSTLGDAPLPSGWAEHYDLVRVS